MHSKFEQLVIVLEVFKVQVSYRAKMLEKTTEFAILFSDVQLTKSENKRDSQRCTGNLRQNHHKGVKGPSNFLDDCWFHSKCGRISRRK